MPPPLGKALGLSIRAAMAKRRTPTTTTTTTTAATKEDEAKEIKTD